MSVPTALAPREQTLQQLQERIRGMQDGVPRLPVATPPALSGLLQLRTGGAYEVDSASLAMALLATPSQEGSWAAVVGASDFGVEAAADFGIDLTRTVLVPDPGEHWLEATVALVDVVPVVLLRTPPGITERTAGRIGARLRKRSGVLIAHGRWPGSEARLTVEASRWSGVDRGHGLLRERRLVVSVVRGSAPARRVELELAPGTGLRRADAGHDAAPAPVRLRGSA